MLLIDPNLPRVRLESGVLYFRLGSYQIAHGHLVRVEESPDVPADVLTRVDGFLAEIDKRLSLHAFSGSMFAGLRWQSNANAGPVSSAVRASGVDATLDDQYTAQKEPENRTPSTHANATRRSAKEILEASILFEPSGRSRGV